MADLALEISPEEERYLRRAFRRYALPYLAGVVAIAALVGWVASGGSGPPVEALHDLEELRASVDALSARVDAVGSELAGDRKRLAALAQRASGGDAVASVESELQSVRNRMFDLEKRLERQPSPERIAGLVERLGRVEADLAAAPPAPGPAPAAPGPLAPAPVAP